MSMNRDQLETVLKAVIACLQKNNLLPQELDTSLIITNVMSGLEGVSLTKDQLLTPFIQHKLMLACIAAFVQTKVPGSSFDYNALVNVDNTRLLDQLQQLKEVFSASQSLARVEQQPINLLIQSIAIALYEMCNLAAQIKNPSLQLPQLAVLRQGVYDDTGQLIAKLDIFIQGIKDSPALQGLAEISKSELFGSSLNLIDAKEINEAITHAFSRLSPFHTTLVPPGSQNG